jgi:SAM-dependent methyltransferase
MCIAIWPCPTFNMKHYKAFPTYYDAEYAHHPMLQRDVPFLMKHLPRRPADILELATGTARAAIPLAQAGHRVTGVDNDPAMLEIARRKRDSVGLSRKNLALVKADILQLKLARRFDWIVLLFNTFLAFPTLQEEDALLQGVVRHLKPGGRFWIDVFQPNLELLAREKAAHIDPSLFCVPELDRTIQRTVSLRINPAKQVQHVTFHYLWFDAHGREHRQNKNFVLTFIFPRELQILLERNGLEVVDFFGDHDGQAFTADSPRMIVSCRLKRATARRR